MTETNWIQVILALTFSYVVHSAILEQYSSREPTSCSKSENEIYDMFQYDCISCEKYDKGNPLIRETDQSCTCPNNYKIISRKNQISVNCEQCLNGQENTTEKLNCIKPLNQPCKSKEIQVEYDMTGQLNDQKNCIECMKNTQPNAEMTRCIPCPVDPLNPNITLCSSSCPDNYEKIDDECFQSEKLSSNISSLYIMKYKGKENIDSKLLRHHFRKTEYKCQYLEDRQSCSFLHNLCSLQMYDSSSQSCKAYEDVTVKNRERKLSSEVKRPPLRIILSDTPLITSQYSFLRSDTNSKLMLKIARYSLYGNLIEIKYASLNSLQICYSPCNHFWFGKWYSNTCSIKAKSLWKSWSTEFYELFLEYGDENQYMIPIPVNMKLLDSEYQTEFSTPTNARRFFLVDNHSGIPVSSMDNKASIVQYAKSVELSIQLKQDETPGKIFVPILTINYAYATQHDLMANKILSNLDFKIVYWRSSDKLNEDISITMGVFSVFAIIFSAVQTWSWCKRTGKLAIDFFVLGKLILYLCSQLANVFLLVIFFVSFLSCLFYKNQKYAVMVLLTKDQEMLFQSYIIAAFCLKCFDMIHVLNTVINIDLFFVDWERPRLPQSKGSAVTHEQSDVYPVSIWRSYFIANEWNKLKVQHQTNTLINLSAVIFFMKLLKLEELAAAQPDAPVIDECSSPFNQMSRFALVVLTFFTSALIQFIIKTFFYEKFITDSKLNQLKDLCSVANISIFVLIHRQYGYYIHGRSVHGHADVDMKIYNEHLKREEENLCGLRGLLPNTSLQTFSVFITRDFATQYNKIKFYNRKNSQRKFGPLFSVSYSHAQGKNMSSFPVERLFAYQTMNKFLSSFIDHGLQDLDYVVKDKLISEKILDIEFQEPAEKSFFFNDHSHSIHRAMLSGHETSFLVWEILLIAILDILSQDFLLATFFTAIIVKMLERIYLSLSRRNLILNSLLDGRFLP